MAGLFTALHQIQHADPGQRMDFLICSRLDWSNGTGAFTTGMTSRGFFARRQRALVLFVDAVGFAACLIGSEPETVSSAAWRWAMAALCFRLLWDHAGRSTYVFGSAVLRMSVGSIKVWPQDRLDI